MKKEKIKKQQKGQKKVKFEGTNMMIGVGLGIVFYLIFRNYIISAVLAIVAATILEIGTSDK